MAILKLIAKFSTSLAAGITTSSPTATLSSILTKKSETLPSGTYGFILDRGLDTEETVIGTLSGSTLTFVTRGISDLDGSTSIPANIFAHRKGSTIELTAHPVFTGIDSVLNGLTALEGILLYPSTRVISNDYHLVDKKYVADTITGFTGLASTTVYGTTKLSVAPVSAIAPIAVGDNDPRVPTAIQIAAMAGSSGTPNSTNKFLTQDDVTVYGTGLNQSSVNASQSVGEADTTTLANKICQTFVAENTSLIAIYLTKKAPTGTNTGNVVIGIYAVDGSGNPTGAALTSATVLAATWNGYVNDSSNYIALTPYALTIGTTYAIQITQTTADTSNHANVGYQNTNVYANGTLKRYNTTDGWVAITGDLTFQLITTTNSKIVRRTSTGTIYLSADPVISSDAARKNYVDNQDAATLAAFTAPQQLVGADTVVTTASTGTKCATDATGTIMVLIQRIAGTWYITRYTTDNGIWYRTHSVTLSWSGSAYNSVTILGSYVYVYGLDTSGPTVKVARFNLADLTSETNMTISGGSPGPTDVGRGIHTDGTFIYLSDTSGAAERSKKYSLAGTTLTFVSNIDYTGAVYDYGIYNDGTYFYILTSVGYGEISIVKYTMATGGAALSTTNRNFNGVFTNPTPIGFIPYSSAKFWIVFAASIDAVKMLEINLITKP